MYTGVLLLRYYLVWFFDCSLALNVSIATATRGQNCNSRVLEDACSVFGSKTLLATVREGQQVLSSGSILASIETIGSDCPTFS